MKPSLALWAALMMVGACLIQGEAPVIAAESAESRPSRVTKVVVTEFLEATWFETDVTNVANQALRDDNNLAKILQNGTYFDTASSMFKARIVYLEKSDAKQLAEDIWYALSHDVRFRGDPCGNHGMGRAMVQGEQEFGLDASAYWRAYKIEYTGNGAINTCTGNRGVGWATYNVHVMITDIGKQEALLVIESGAE